MLDFVSSDCLLQLSTDGNYFFLLRFIEIGSYLPGLALSF